MSGNKQTLTIKEFKPGYVSAGDFPDTLNPGYKTFKNFLIDSVGNVLKPHGWKNIINYDETGKDNGNIAIDYSRLTTGSGGYPRTDVFYCKNYASIVNGVKTEYKDVLMHKIINGINTLWHIRLDVNDNVVLQKQISTNGQWKEAGPVKCIETPEQLYIVNSRNKLISSYNILEEKKYKSVVCPEQWKGAVWKYNFAVGNRANDVEKLQNISIANPNNFTAYGIKDSNSKYNIHLQNRFYVVVPVYNTGTKAPCGAGLKLLVSPVPLYTQSSDATYKAQQDYINNIGFAQISVPPFYDPYIKYLRVYRTKERVQNGINVATETDPYYFCFQMELTAAMQTVQNSTPHRMILYAGSVPEYSSGVNGVNKQIISDYLKDTELGSELSNDILFNSFTHEWNDNQFSVNPPATLYDDGIDFFAHAGCYAQNRLFLLDDKFIYLSDIGKSDGFSLPPYAVKYQNLENPTTAIEEVGQNIFVWNKNGGLTVLRPTQSTDIPYVVEPLDSGIGCDSLNSVCVLNRTAYFIFKNKLYAMNEFGQYQEISQGINSVLAKFDIGYPSEIILKTNNKDGYIKIMFRNAWHSPYLPINIDFYPGTGIWVENTGYKDIFLEIGGTNELILTPHSSGLTGIKREQYQLLNYQYLPDTNEEWGVDFDGNVVKRSADYSNVSVGSDKTTWQNFTYSGTVTPVKSYPIESVMERGLHFSAKIFVNAIILYGTGNIKYNYALDNKVYQAKTKTVLMKELGAAIHINALTNLLLYKLTHDTAEALQFDFMEIIYNGTHKITIKNTVSAGV